jgi:hypothetical protein
MFDMVCDAFGRRAGAVAGGASAEVAWLAAPFNASSIVIFNNRVNELNGNVIMRSKGRDG